MPASNMIAFNVMTNLYHWGISTHTVAFLFWTHEELDALRIGHFKSFACIASHKISAYTVIL